MKVCQTKIVQEPQNFTERLLFLIEARNVKITQIAKVTGIPQPYLSNLKNGKKINPSLETVDKLAKFFLVRNNWLYSGEEPMDRPDEASASTGKRKTPEEYVLFIQSIMDEIGSNELPILEASQQYQMFLQSVDLFGSRLSQNGLILEDALGTIKHQPFLATHDQSNQSPEMPQTISKESEKSSKRVYPSDKAQLVKLQMRAILDDEFSVLGRTQQYQMLLLAVNFFGIRLRQCGVILPEALGRIENKMFFAESKDSDKSIEETDVNV